MLPKKRKHHYFESNVKFQKPKPLNAIKDI